MWDNKYGGGRDDRRQDQTYWAVKHQQCATWRISNGGFGGSVSVSRRVVYDKEAPRPAYGMKDIGSGDIVSSVVSDMVFQWRTSTAEASGGRNGDGQKVAVITKSKQ